MPPTWKVEPGHTKPMVLCSARSDHHRGEPDHPRRQPERPTAGDFMPAMTYIDGWVMDLDQHLRHLIEPGPSEVEPLAAPSLDLEPSSSTAAYPWAAWDFIEAVSVSGDQFPHVRRRGRHPTRARGLLSGEESNPNIGIAMTQSPRLHGRCRLHEHGPFRHPEVRAGPSSTASTGGDQQGGRPTAWSAGLPAVPRTSPWLQQADRGNKYTYQRPRPRPCWRGGFPHGVSFEFMVPGVNAPSTERADPEGQLASAAFNCRHPGGSPADILEDVYMNKTANAVFSDGPTRRTRSPTTSSRVRAVGLRRRAGIHQPGEVDSDDRGERAAQPERAGTAYEQAVSSS